MLSRDAAETLALDALTWLLGEDDLLPTFLGTTGASIEDFRTQTQDPAFLVSVLDFICMNDAWVKSFCDVCGYSYEGPTAARTALPGGETVHWT
ncbi:MAG: DUF3572 domain-containing protein [Pseudomonadota bacterium]